MHAADVAQSLFHFLSSAGLGDSFSPRTKCAAILAAIVHDVVRARRVRSSRRGSCELRRGSHSFVHHCTIDRATRATRTTSTSLSTTTSRSSTCTGRRSSTCTARWRSSCSRTPSTTSSKASPRSSSSRYERCEGSVCWMTLSHSCVCASGSESDHRHGASDGQRGSLDVPGEARRLGEQVRDDRRQTSFGVAILIDSRADWRRSSDEGWRLCDPDDEKLVLQVRFNFVCRSQFVTRRSPLMTLRLEP